MEDQQIVALRERIAQLEGELALVPVSRQRMMRRSFAAARQRDLLEGSLLELLFEIKTHWAHEKIATQAHVAANAILKSRDIGKVFDGARPMTVRVAA